jgi:hypothetical protein
MRIERLATPPFEGVIHELPFQIFRINLTGNNLISQISIIS